MDRQRILERIAKCFALAKDSGASPQEAETALRHARKLMDQYDLDVDDVAATQAHSSSVPTGTKRAPQDWLFSLANTCADAFDCEVLACPTRGGLWRFDFIGIGISAELASYAYSALHHQLLLARKEHVASLTRCKLATKRRRGRIFAENWIDAVHRTVRTFAGGPTAETQRTLEAYFRVHHPSATTRELEYTPVNSRDEKSRMEGFARGSQARLHRGVASGAEQLRLGGAR